MTPRPPLPRTFIIIAFGPLVGAAVMSVIMLTVAVLESPDNVWEYLLYAIALYLAFGYLAGMLPAVGAALLWRFVPKNWRPARRVVAAILIGAATGAVLVWPFMSLFMGFMPPNPIFAGLAALCGALALLATALPGA